MTVIMFKDENDLKTLLKLIETLNLMKTKSVLMDKYNFTENMADEFEQELQKELKVSLQQLISLHS